MKIRSLELFTVAPRWLFLKVTTESGLVGWGEPVVEGKLQRQDGSLSVRAERFWTIPEFERMRQIRGHASADVRKYMRRGIVQCVVEIEQPYQTGIAGHCGRTTGRVTGGQVF